MNLFSRDCIGLDPLNRTLCVPNSIQFKMYISLLEFTTLIDSLIPQASASGVQAVNNFKSGGPKGHYIQWGSNKVLQIKILPLLISGVIFNCLVEPWMLLICFYLIIIKADTYLKIENNYYSLLAKVHHCYILSRSSKLFSITLNNSFWKRWTGPNLCHQFITFFIFSSLFFFFF